MIAPSFSCKLALLLGVEVRLILRELAEVRKFAKKEKKRIHIKEECKYYFVTKLMMA